MFSSRLTLRNTGPLSMPAWRSHWSSARPGTYIRAAYARADCRGAMSTSLPCPSWSVFDLGSVMVTPGRGVGGVRRGYRPIPTVAGLERTRSGSRLGPGMPSGDQGLHDSHNPPESSRACPPRCLPALFLWSCGCRRRPGPAGDRLSWSRGTAVGFPCASRRWPPACS